MKNILTGLLLTMVLGFGGFRYLTSPMSTLEKLEDKVAYKNMLLKNQQGGVVDYSEKLEIVDKEIKGLRQQLAVEDQARRNK